MDPYSYGWEKLHVAVHCLAGRGDRPARLLNAVVSSLIRIEPIKDLPPEIRDRFTALMTTLTSRPAKQDEGTAKSTIEAMDDSGVDQAVEEIISFYDTVCRHRDPN